MTAGASAGAGDRVAPPSSTHLRSVGRQARARLPRAELARLAGGGRDPLGIIAAQNATRVSELLPLRAERMTASPFAFYRGTAAIMAADLARDGHTGILVAACGDAHLANFGFYASPQRTLVFDLNDFDEAAWAPWEWDLKRLVTSVVVAGQATGRAEAVVREAALGAVRGYARSLSASVARSPVERYFEHFDPRATLTGLDHSSRSALEAAIRDAEKRTGERAARRLTEVGDDGSLAFVERPPTMTHVTDELRRGVQGLLAEYAATVKVDIALLLRQYALADLVRRVVGVGSVGTRCHLAALQDGDGNVLILQTKEAGPSVLAQFGGIEQPPDLAEGIAASGEGARVVALQRVLQAFSDPFLGHLRFDGRDYYVRQFHDMKGGVEVEVLDDPAFRRYALACAATLARSHAQSPAAASVAGYVGGGKAVGEAVLEWAYAYADLSRADYGLFVAAQE